MEYARIPWATFELGDKAVWVDTLISICKHKACYNDINLHPLFGIVVWIFVTALLFLHILQLLEATLVRSWGGWCACAQWFFGLLTCSVFASIFNLMCTRVEISSSSYLTLVVFWDALAALIWQVAFGEHVWIFDCLWSLIDIYCKHCYLLVLECSSSCTFATVGRWRLENNCKMRFLVPGHFWACPFTCFYFSQAKCLFFISLVSAQYCFTKKKANMVVT